MARWMLDDPPSTPRAGREGTRARKREGKYSFPVGLPMPLLLLGALPVW